MLDLSGEFECCSWIVDGINMNPNELLDWLHSKLPDSAVDSHIDRIKNAEGEIKILGFRVMPNGPASF